MKRFDKDQDRKLRYSEFCDAFLPVDSFHASLLAKKAPLTMYPISALPKSQIFYPETCDMFINTFSLHIKNEIEAEKLRIDTQRKAGYSAHEAFSILDSNGDQFIDKEDVSAVILPITCSFTSCANTLCATACTSQIKSCAR